MPKLGCKLKETRPYALSFSSKAVKSACLMKKLIFQDILLIT
jgi:hypothetical protein